MRLWSIDFQYLDRKNLVALWREGLGAMKALDKLAIGEKYGYQNHPQLDRFKKCKNYRSAIRVYLTGVYIEANKRGYNFDISKTMLTSESLIIDFKELLSNKEDNVIELTKGQLNYEFDLLKGKLKDRSERDRKKRLEKGIEKETDSEIKYNEIKNIREARSECFFKLIDGDIENWEKNIKPDVVKLNKESKENGKI